jgi:hypothetical protein
MWVICYSETSIHFQRTIRRSISEDGTIFILVAKAIVIFQNTHLRSYCLFFSVFLIIYYSFLKEYESVNLRALINDTKDYKI